MKEGRPVEMPNRERGLNVSIYVDKDMMDLLEEIRWRERKSISALVRIAVQQYIKSHASGNDTFKLDEWQKDPSFQAVPTILSDPQTWFRYLQDCTPEDRTKILKQANIIRTNAINIGNLRKK